MSSSQLQLSTEERRFFSLVNRAVFANPFSDEREALDREIAGRDTGMSGQTLLDQTLQQIFHRIETMDRDGRCDIHRYTGEDRELIENSLLFEFFHRYMERFDRLILDQIEAGKKSLKVPFAAEAFDSLQGRGFRRNDVRRYFEVVYQLRRAFFFIDRNLVGCSPGMQNVRRELWNNVFTHDLNLYNRYLWDRMEDFSTLILGETGTGKGTAAAAIGRSGFIPFDEKHGCFAESFTESFVSLNLSQFPENLIESELFGHKKGAFTGAVDDYKGVFDRCRPYGSIFLDEIGEVSIPVQIKLLQVLQERDYSPVGSHNRHRFNGRVIAATNRSLAELRRKGRMRDDFFYRLCSDVVVVPPLRERIQQDPRELDELINLIIRRLLGKVSSEIRGMVRRVIDRQLGRNYPWPGNVRELEQCIRRVLLNRSYTGEVRSGESDLLSVLTDGIRSGTLEAQQLLAGYCYLQYRTCGTYEEVARRVKLDRRTVKKYIDEWEPPSGA